MPASEVYRTFRFSPEAIMELTTTLQDDITSPTHRSHEVEPLFKVMATLNFLATGSFQHTSGVVAGMAQSSNSSPMCAPGYPCNPETHGQPNHQTHPGGPAGEGNA